jgi:hypothetical protein
MSEKIVTVVDAVVAAERESELIDGFRRLVASSRPDGLLRTELLRGQEGRWRIQTTWRDRESVMALRAAGQPPAALELLKGLGATHTHGVFSVVETHEG